MLAVATGCKPEEPGDTLYAGYLKIESRKLDDPAKEIDPKGHRLPPPGAKWGVKGVKVRIDGFDTSDIISFEVFTPSGDTIATFRRECDFAEYILAHPADYEVHFLLSSGDTLKGTITKP